jgi:beta-N-acetylhexosaminidase
MEGAAIMGGPAERAHQALVAGCDMILVCNQRDAQVEVLDNLPVLETPGAEVLSKKQSFTLADLQRSSEWKQASEAMRRMLED